MYFAYKRLFLLKIGSKERFFNIELLSSTIHRPPFSERAFKNTAAIKIPQDVSPAEFYLLPYNYRTTPFKSPEIIPTTAPR